MIEGIIHDLMALRPAGDHRRWERWSQRFLGQLRDNPFVSTLLFTGGGVLLHRLLLLLVDDIPLLDWTLTEFVLWGVVGVVFALGCQGVALGLRSHQREVRRALQQERRRAETLQTTGLLGLSRATEARDSSTVLHHKRVGPLSELIARRLAQHDRYGDYINETYLNDLRVASALHDIGRVGVADAVLHKPGGLTMPEFELMKMHVIIGGDLVGELQRNLPFRSYYALAREIAYHHHQRWDGTGYPNVLKQGDTPALFIQEGIGEPLRGMAIPLAARIVAVVDVYDALISPRSYKEAYSHDEACRLISEEKGRHFDPDVVDAFVGVQAEVARIVQETVA